MTTSRLQLFLSDVVEARTLPESAFVYFRGKLQNDVHVLILKAFLRSGLTQKQLAKRTGKSASVVNRWIGATGNWELNSVAEFLAGMNAQLKVSLDFFDEKPSGLPFQVPMEPVRKSHKTMERLSRAAASNGKGLDKTTLDSALDRLIKTMDGVNRELDALLAKAKGE
jgi:transcriptional regulator with XRE-family HTH domain